MPRYVCHLAKFKVHEKDVDKAKRLIAAFIRNIQKKEPGTLVYDSFQDAEDPTHFVHTMVFQNAKAEKAHQGSAYCAAFVEGLYPICVEPPQFSDWRLIATRSG